MSGMPVIDRIPSRVRAAIVIALRLLIAAVFLAAAIPKLGDPAAFAEAIANYHVLPDALLGPSAVALPAIELVVAIALITGVHARGAALLSLAMLLVFVAAESQALARGIDLECGCFGEAVQRQVSGETIAQNVVLALACIPLLLARAREPADQKASLASRSRAKT